MSSGPGHVFFLNSIFKIVNDFFLYFRVWQKYDGFIGTGTRPRGIVEYQMNETIIKYY